MIEVQTRRRRFAELGERIAAYVRTDGDHETLIPGLFVSRRTQIVPCYRASCQPSLSVFAGGRKRIELGGVAYICDRSSFFLSSIDVPIQSEILEASRSAPFLCMRLYLDLEAAREILIRDEGVFPRRNTRGRGLAVGESSPGLLSACIRLLDLIETPEDIPGLNPLIQREIVYRILQTPQAQSLRAVATLGDLSNRTTRVMSWLRQNYRKPLRMEELAEIAHMGVSTLHHQFRALTAMSPLQYQKQIRLQTARERMLMDGVTASTAAYEVGYESISQFSREYSRLFGQPPVRDVRTQMVRRESSTLVS